MYLIVSCLLTRIGQMGRGDQVKGTECTEWVLNDLGQQWGIQLNVIEVFCGCDKHAFCFLILQLTLIAFLSVFHFELELIAFTLLLCSHLHSFPFHSVKTVVWCFFIHGFQSGCYSWSNHPLSHYQWSCLSSPKLFHTIHCFLQKGLVILLMQNSPSGNSATTWKWLWVDTEWTII